MTKLEFEKSIGKCDEVFADYVVTDKPGYFTVKSETLMFVRYFRAGYEVGFWCVPLNSGMSFDSREWSEEFKKYLRKIENHWLTTL